MIDIKQQRMYTTAAFIGGCIATLTLSRVVPLVVLQIEVPYRLPPELMS